MKRTGLFVPYRKVPTSQSQRALEAITADATRAVGAALQGMAIAMDVIPERGSIALRDEGGQVWVITVQRSDVATLICETEKS